MNELEHKLDQTLKLLTLALEMEKEGHYNIAKLARATADSFCRQAAYQHSNSGIRQELTRELTSVIESLSRLNVDEKLLNAFQAGASALSAGRIPSIGETPHPYVCRTCGNLVMGTVTEKCPTCEARPDTFQLFAPIYWLDAFDPPQAMHILRQTPQEVAGLLEGLAEQYLTRVPAEGGWSILNAVTHIRDAQGVLDYRLELFGKEQNPVLEAKAVWSWAAREQDRPASTLEIFADYQSTRAAILERLGKLPLEDWWRTGSHQEFGTVSLKQQVSYFAAHERTHLPQIARLRESFL